MARRYSSAFGMKIACYETRIESGKDIFKIFEETMTDANLRSYHRADTGFMVLGAVDNNRARLAMMDWLLPSDGTYYQKYWIDAGNESWHGQAIMGSHCSGISTAQYAKIGQKGYTPRLPSYFEEYPNEILKAFDKVEKSANHCALNVAVDPQTIQANMFSAMSLTALAIQVIGGEVSSRSCYFDAMTGNCRADVLTKERVVEAETIVFEAKDKLRDILRGKDLHGFDGIEKYLELSELSDSEE